MAEEQTQRPGDSMKAEDARQYEFVGQAFLEARSLQGDARHEFLMRLDARGAPLRAEVEALLAAEDAEVGLLDEPGGAFRSQVIQAAEALTHGNIGSYRIIR